MRKMLRNLLADEGLMKVAFSPDAMTAIRMMKRDDSARVARLFADPDSPDFFCEVHRIWPKPGTPEWRLDAPPKYRVYHGRQMRKGGEYEKMEDAFREVQRHLGEINDFVVSH